MNWKLCEVPGDSQLSINNFNIIFDIPMTCFNIKHGGAKLIFSY